MKIIKSFEQNAIKSLSLKIYEDFLSINRNNKLKQQHTKYKKIQKPDITIIMTIFNQAHCLNICLRSIQNQSISKIEIIIVDDCSLDNSLEIIKKYQKEDPRIILIKHDSNEGAIKSRSDGIRKAKGKYITIIDGDDAFIHKDILKNSLYIAKKANLDIVEFRAAMFKRGKLFRILNNYRSINFEYIIYQPELRSKFFCLDEGCSEGMLNRVIWGKLIKAKIFKRMLGYVGSKYTEDFIIFAEDTIMSISLFQLANSYYLMKEIGYIYTLDQKKSKISLAKNSICKAVNKIKDFDFFKFLQYLVEKTGKDEKEQIMIFKEIISNNFPLYLNKIKMDIRQYQIIVYIIDKALEFEFLSKIQKDKLIYLKKGVNKKYSNCLNKII